MLIDKLIGWDILTSMFKKAIAIKRLFFPVDNRFNRFWNYSFPLLIAGVGWPRIGCLSEGLQTLLSINTNVTDATATRHIIRVE